MLKALKKRIAIRSYRNKLGPCLQRRYGRRPNYTPLQLRNAALSSGVNLEYLCFAYAMYCTRENFDAHHAATGETCDGHACIYDAMQAETGAGGPVSGSGHSFDSSDNSADSGGGDGGGGDGGGGGDD